MKVSTIQYARTLFELTENKSQDEVLDVLKNFAEKLKKDGQLKNAGKIMEKFGELYNIANGIIEAGVTSSRELSSDQVHQVKSFIKDKYAAKEVELKVLIDEKIQGGIIIKVGDEVFDSSIETMLKKLHQVLLK